MIPTNNCSVVRFVKLAVLLSSVLVTCPGSAAETPAVLHWNQLPSLPDKHGFAGTFAGVSGDASFAMVTTPAVVWNNRVVIPGGESRPGVRSTEVWQSGDKGMGTRE